MTAKQKMAQQKATGAAAALRSRHRKAQEASSHMAARVNQAAAGIRPNVAESASAAEKLREMSRQMNAGSHLDNRFSDDADAFLAKHGYTWEGKKRSGQDFNILGHAALPGGHAGYGI
jgi:hypothetical protein